MPQARILHGSVGEQSRLRWLQELAAYIREFVELPPLRLPRFQPEEPVSMEALASAARTYFHAGSGPIASVTALLENHGCVVTRLPSGGDHAGFALLSFDDIPYAGISCGRQPSECRVVMAQALGYWMLFDQVEPAELTKRAEDFARAFLLPAKSFGKEVWSPTIDALLSLKRHWNCPLAVLLRRCADLDLLDSEQARRALGNIGRRGWKTEEPGELAGEAEQPRLLAQSVRLLLDSGVKDVHSLLADVALGAGDVEELAGLPKDYLRGVDSVVEWAPRLRRASAG